MLETCFLISSQASRNSDSYKAIWAASRPKLENSRIMSSFKSNDDNVAATDSSNDMPTFVFKRSDNFTTNLSRIITRVLRRNNSNSVWVKIFPQAACSPAVLRYVRRLPLMPLSAAVVRSASVNPRASRWLKRKSNSVTYFWRCCSPT